jgi:hypothetical protein
MLISYSLLVYAILEYLDSLATAPNRIFIGIQKLTITRKEVNFVMERKYIDKPSGEASLNTRSVVSHKLSKDLYSPQW